MALFGGGVPVILKEGSDAQTHLAALELLRGTLSPEGERQLESDIRAVKAGIVGEERILYELRNSHQEMYVLQDLFLEHGGLTAQIDFLVITPQRNFVLECKNLYGDITITDRGDFVRSFGGGRREGIYSPITQNQRHLELIREMRRSNRSLAMNLLFDRDFSDVYRSYVVLANPKTVLHDRGADSAARSQVIRADQLTAVIKAVNDERGPGREKTFRSATRDLAEWFLAQHKDNPVDYVAKSPIFVEIRQICLKQGICYARICSSRVTWCGKDPAWRSQSSCHFPLPTTGPSTHRRPLTSQTRMGNRGRLRSYSGQTRAENRTAVSPCRTSG